MSQKHYLQDEKKRLLTLFHYWSVWSTYYFDDLQSLNNKSICSTCHFYATTWLAVWCLITGLQFDNWFAGVFWLLGPHLSCSTLPGKSSNHNWYEIIVKFKFALFRRSLDHVDSRLGNTLGKKWSHHETLNQSHLLCCTLVIKSIQLFCPGN